MVLKKIYKRVFAFLIAGFVLSSAYAAKIPDYKGRVNDFADVINSIDEDELETYLEQLDLQTGIQIMVLTVPSLEGEDIASYGIKVADKWQPGHNGKEDGAILIVAMEEHDVRIEVGDSLEDELTDVKCGLIIRNVIIPEFRNGAYSNGIVKGVKNMGGVASGNAELVATSVLNEESSGGDMEGFIFFIIWIVFVFIVVMSKGGLFKWFFLSRIFGGSSYNSGRRHYVPPRTNFGGGSHSGGFSGGGSFHTGGGHFSGGGASGHW